MTNETLPEVWVTKYALTTGITKIGSAGIIKSNALTINTVIGYFHKPHWHTTEAAAKAHAEQMRLKKIASLRKQIEKLEALKF